MTRNTSFSQSPLRAYMKGVYEKKIKFVIADILLILNIILICITPPTLLVKTGDFQMAVIKKGEHFTESGFCYECGEIVGDIAVQYVFWGVSKKLDGSIAEHAVLHPDCAVTVGNRLISDGYPNRQKK